MTEHNHSIPIEHSDAVGTPEDTALIHSAIGARRDGCQECFDAVLVEISARPVTMVAITRFISQVNNLPMTFGRGSTGEARELRTIATIPFQSRVESVQTLLVSLADTAHLKTAFTKAWLPRP